jgi:cytochrome c peroxidase
MHNGVEWTSHKSDMLRLLDLTDDEIMQLEVL